MTDSENCCKHTQDAPRGVYSFVPDLPLDQMWTDKKLYERYGLTMDEIAFIEARVAEHDDTPLENVTERANE